MLWLSIDYAGCVDNPHFSSMDELGCKNGWAALIHRSGTRLKIAAFLPRNKTGAKVNVAGLQRGLFIAFGVTVGSQKLRSLFIIEAVDDVGVLFRSVEEVDVPSIYEIDIAGRYNLYLLTAKQVMLEAQMNDIKKWMLEFKGVNSS